MAFLGGLGSSFLADTALGFDNALDRAERSAAAGVAIELATNLAVARL